MSDFLSKIYIEKQKEVMALKERYPFSQIKHEILKRNKFYNFHLALKHTNRISIIAEVKFASPSKGKIRNNASPVDIALEYQGAGADALSVLTDKKHFSGSFETMSNIRDFVELPILCKDFIVDEFQIYYARARGADAILLIVAMFKDNIKRLKELHKCARDLNMDVLCETHNKEEIEQALDLVDPRIIGVNARDLKTLQVNVNTFMELIPLIPEDKIRVAESGITDEFLPDLKRLDVDAVLVGEYFMRQANIYYSMHRFVEQCRWE